MATAEPSSSAMATKPGRDLRPQSPPAQASKRDKKRQVLSEKLALLTDQMSRDRDRSYREELQKIQVDLNLVGRVDPYADRPLDEIQREYRELSQASANGTDRPNRTLLEMAGPSFQDWVHNVEDLIETRDYDLTSQKYEYERRLQENHNTCAYKIEVAKREYRALSSTLRDRLINAITSKKARLSREKEALEISDSSALGPPVYAARWKKQSGYADNKKRKRNGGDEDGSPAPIRRALDGSNTTPLWQNDRIRAMRKETGPIYSIDKLFTDKELSMNYNTAALASYKYLLTRRDANGNVLTPPEDSEMGNGDAHEEDEELAAPTMERAPSHATRSTRGGQNAQHNFLDDKVLGIEGLANFEIAGNLDKMGTQEPKLPPLIHSQYSKAYVKSESNTPMGLNQDDAQQDFMIMNVFKSYQRHKGTGSNIDVPNGGRRLLENMVQSPAAPRHVAYIQGQRPSVENLSESLGVPSSSLRDEPGLGSSILSGLAPGVVANNHASPAPPHEPNE
ncbi:hypothetical protein PG989_012213 [Apiospora arundinis]